ncbi:MAG: hypothetical protein PHO01_02420 [Desulfotomaculaceae bacterium]|nr:hypothetical protein [Desulfotomaculaceae bacterium]
MPSGSLPKSYRSARNLDQAPSALLFVLAVMITNDVLVELTRTGLGAQSRVLALACGTPLAGGAVQSLELPPWV